MTLTFKIYYEGRCLEINNDFIEKINKRALFDEEAREIIFGLCGKQDDLSQVKMRKKIKIFKLLRELIGSLPSMKVPWSDFQKKKPRVWVGIVQC